MAEQPTFASEVTTEKSESERIRERIQTYQASISPNSLQVISVLLEQQLKAGLIKSTDLEALVMLRDEVNKATIDYRTMMEREQKRLQEITVQEAEQKQIELAKRENAFNQKLADERQLRKTTQDRLAQMEAVLKSHGISMDLDGDGQVGLAEGQEERTLTPEEQAEVDRLLQESKDAVSVQKDNIAPAPLNKPKSRAFEMARALNPAPISEDEEFVEKVEETKKSFKEWEEETVTENQLELDIDIPEDAKGTDEFEQEVANVIDEQMKVAAEMEIDDEDYDEVPDLRVAEEDTESTPSLPKISDGQVSPENASVLKTDKVKVIEETPEGWDANGSPVVEEPEAEEEYEEITIPSESELKSMTKKQIAEAATELGFDVSVSSPKATMISSFTQQTDDFIASLQDSGEFVSAETDDNDEEDNKDGGYF